MEEKFFIDTSAWLAILLKSERTHTQVAYIFNDIVNQKSLLYTSCDILDETMTRLIYDVGWHSAKKFFAYFSESIVQKQIVQLFSDEQTQQDAYSVLEKYKDHTLSFTDATTVVSMRRFKISKIITLDSDFAKIGFLVLPLV